MKTGGKETEMTEELRLNRRITLLKKIDDIYETKTPMISMRFFLLICRRRRHLNDPIKMKRK